jgi:hypothetical protein
VSTRQQWLVGCGVGCGVLLLVGIGSCVVASLYLRHTFRGIQKATESHEALTARFGDIDEYVPPANGAPAAGRMESFVRVREATADARDAVEAVLGQLPPSELSEDGSVIGKIRIGLDVLGDLIDSMGTYLETRNEVLLQEEMPIGEYVYLYTLTYYSWLGHSPVEAPRQEEDPDGARVGVFDDNDALFGEGTVRRRYRRYIIAMLRRQRDSIGAGAGPGAAWRERIEEELRRLEVDPGHVLWQDDLPEAIESSLRPFRARVEASWSAATNRIELPLADHERPWDRE